MSWLRGGIWNPPPRPKARFFRVIVQGLVGRVVARVERVGGFAKNTAEYAHRVLNHVRDAAHFTDHPALFGNAHGLRLKHVVGLVLTGEPLRSTHRHIRTWREPGHEREPAGTDQYADLVERFLACVILKSPRQ